MEAGARFDQFTLKKLLGAGGMGEVWLAWDGTIGRWVALKFLKGGNTEAIARFQREAQIASRLTHPNIAAIYEVGPTFIAMQFVEGRTLKPGGNAAKLISVAARAVHFAHEQGIVHRDLKPENLMVTKEGHLFVMDFGLARPAEGKSDVSRSGLLVGTPHYMSPEQANAGRVDARADVYSLGATLYELATKRKPIPGGNVVEILANVIGREPQPMQGVDRDLRTIVMRCLEKDRGRRYATASELADDLDRYLEGRPISAHAPSMFYRLRKFARRRTAMILIASIGLVAAAAIAGVVVPGLKGEQKARIEGETALKRERKRSSDLKDLGSRWAEILLARQGLYKGTEDPARVMQQVRAAVDRVGDYIRKHPDQPQGLYVRARGYLYLNELRKAEEDLRQALVLNREFAPGEALLGRLLIDRYLLTLYTDQFDKEVAGRHDAGRESLMKEAREHLAKGWVEGAERASVSRWGLAKTPEDDVTEVMLRALVAWYVNGDTPEARRILESEHRRKASEDCCNLLGKFEETYEERVRWQTAALEVMPHCVPAFMDRGVDHMGRDRWKEAREDFSRVVKIDPLSAMAWNNRAHVRSRLGDMPGSLEDSSRAVELEPGNGGFLCNRGIFKRHTRDFAGALADLSRASELRPDYGSVYLNRGNVYSDLGDWQTAIQDYTKGLSLDPNMVEAFLNRGNSRHNVGDFKGAIADYSRAIELQPDFAGGYAGRATARAELRQYAVALQDYDRAIQIDPRSTWALVNRGNIRSEMGNFEGALRDLDAAVALEPGNPDVYVSRGIAYRLKGDPARAELDFLKALDLAPPDWPRRAAVEQFLSAIRKEGR